MTFLFLIYRSPSLICIVTFICLELGWSRRSESSVTRVLVLWGTALMLRQLRLFRWETPSHFYADDKLRCAFTHFWFSDAGSCIFSLNVLLWFEKCFVVFTVTLIILLDHWMHHMSALDYTCFKLHILKYWKGNLENGFVGDCLVVVEHSLDLPFLVKIYRIVRLRLCVLWTYLRKKMHQLESEDFLCGLNLYLQTTRVLFLWF